MYRIKHKPSGLYYQPIKNGNHLSERGKMYHTKQNILSMGYYSDGEKRRYLIVYCRKNSIVYKKYKEFFDWEEHRNKNLIKAKTNADEWILEEL